MKVCTCFLLFTILFVYTHSITPKEPSRSLNLALKTVLKFNGKDKTENLKILDKVKNFITRVETEIDNRQNYRRNFGGASVETLTGFVAQAIAIINTYDDATLKDFYNIFNEEIRKYHYRRCKFHEFTDNNEIREVMASKLDQIKSEPVITIRAYMKMLADIIKDGSYDSNVKDFVDYINSLYRKEDRGKFEIVLISLKNYTKVKSKDTTDLVKLIRDGVRSIIFDHYTDLNSNVRRELKDKIYTFWQQFHRSTTTTKIAPNNEGHIQAGLDDNTIVRIPAIQEMKYQPPDIVTKKLNSAPINIKRDIIKNGNDLKTVILNARRDSKKYSYNTAIEDKDYKYYDDRLSTEITFPIESFESNSIEFDLEQQREINTERYMTLFPEEINPSPTVYGKPYMQRSVQMTRKQQFVTLWQEAITGLPKYIQNQITEPPQHKPNEMKLASKSKKLHHLKNKKKHRVKHHDLSLEVWKLQAQHNLLNLLKNASKHYWNYNLKNTFMQKLKLELQNASLQELKPESENVSAQYLKPESQNASMEELYPESNDESNQEITDLPKSETNHTFDNQTINETKNHTINETNIQMVNQTNIQTINETNIQTINETKNELKHKLKQKFKEKPNRESKHSLKHKSIHSKHKLKQVTKIPWNYKFYQKSLEEWNGPKYESSYETVKHVTGRINVKYESEEESNLEEKYVSKHKFKFDSKEERKYKTKHKSQNLYRLVSKQKSKIVPKRQPKYESKNIFKQQIKCGNKNKKNANCGAENLHKNEISYEDDDERSRKSVVKTTNMYFDQNRATNIPKVDDSNAYNPIDTQFRPLPSSSRSRMKRPSTDFVPTKPISFAPTIPPTYANKKYTPYTQPSVKEFTMSEKIPADKNSRSQIIIYIPTRHQNNVTNTPYNEEVYNKIHALVREQLEKRLKEVESKTSNTKTVKYDTDKIGFMEDVGMFNNARHTLVKNSKRRNVLKQIGRPDETRPFGINNKVAKFRSFTQLNNDGEEESETTAQYITESTTTASKKHKRTETERNKKSKKAPVQLVDTDFLDETRKTGEKRKEIDVWEIALRRSANYNNITSNATSARDVDLFIPVYLPVPYATKPRLINKQTTAYNVWA